MPSIVDVARQANVSVATVSRTLNGERNVAPATALAVEQAVKEVGYVPRAVRPGPKPKGRRGINTGTIAFLSVGSLSPAEMYRMPAFPALLGGIQRGVERHGMELTLAHLPEGKIVPPVLARRRADGVLLFGDQALSAPLEQAVHRVPAVWCFLRGQVAPNGTFDHVMYDNSHVGQMAAEYLLGRGHRELMFASSGSSHEAYSARRKQFLRCVAEHGSRACVVEGPSQEDGSSAIPAAVLAVVAQRVIEDLRGRSTRPTAIFVASDDLMVAVFNRLRQEGMEPGRDVELIGCNNDLPYLGQLHPRPATIDIRLDLVGERSVDQLLRRMSHPVDQGQTDVLIKPVIVPAESQGAVSRWEKEEAP